MDHNLRMGLDTIPVVEHESLSDSSAVLLWHRGIGFSSAGVDKLLSSVMHSNLGLFVCDHVDGSECADLRFHMDVAAEVLPIQQLRCRLMRRPMVLDPHRLHEQPLATASCALPLHTLV